VTEVQYLSATDAACILGVSDTTVRNRIASGAIKAAKHGKAWRIPCEEIERLTEAEPKVRHDAEELRNGGEAEPKIRYGAEDFRQDTEGEPSPLESRAEALAIEVEVLRTKLSAAEQHHEAAHQELQTANDQLRQDHDRTQRLLENALDSIGSLTEQMKAQSILQHQLQQHRALEAPSVEEPAKPGMLKRWFGRGRRRPVRIGHAT
jgi:excisionase family DNA binding protein